MEWVAFGGMYFFAKVFEAATDPEKRWRYRVRTDPFSYIEFEPRARAPASGNLKIINSNELPMMFKIKSSRPGLHIFRPSACIVGPNSEINCEVLFSVQLSRSVSTSPYH